LFEAGLTGPTGGTMEKSSLLRRSAEILAGLVIVVTTIAYTSVSIRNAGADALQLMTSETRNPGDDGNNGLSPEEDISDLSSVDGSLNIDKIEEYENEQNDENNNRYVLSALRDTTVDGPQESENAASDGSEVPVQEQQPVSETASPVYKFVNVNLLNVRKGPGSDTEKLTSLPKAARVQCLNSDDEWIKIITDDNVEGYVFAEYLSDTAPPVYKFVVVNAVNLRKGPSSETELLGTISFGNKVQVFETADKYVRVLTNSGVEGYIWKEYLGDETVLASRSSSSGQYYNSDLAGKIIEYAKQFVGVKYVYGGSSPNGFDCSGFTQYVFKKFNIKVPRSAAEYANIGTKVSRENLKPGDILLFDRNNDYRLGHVGIYIGNDKFIHASSSKGKVVIATLSKYSGNILGIRRVIK